MTSRIHRKQNNEFYGEEYFEGKGSNYWWTVGSYENLSWFPHWREIVKVLLEFKNNGKLLDIGCAYGFFMNATSNHFNSYGIDISRFALERSKRYFSRDVSMASAANLPFSDKSFDIITLIDVLEHVERLNQCLKDIKRILKKNGILFLQLPNSLIWNRIFEKFGLEDKTHINNFTLSQWTSLLKINGLRIEKVLGMFSSAIRRFRHTRFFIKSQRAIWLLPTWWIVAKK